ncbi:hypothetical protein MMC32_006499 [Xylographa parallela]|nr:hypothetical protein [Xylographa parallela]
MSFFTHDTSISLLSDDAKDPSISLHSTLRTVSTGQFLVPVPKNPHFYGRHGELQLLERHLKVIGHTPSSDYPVVAIYGLGGVGYGIGSKDIATDILLTASTFRKTQLVTQYAYNHRKNNPHASIVWVTAKSEHEIDAQFRQIAKRLSSSDPLCTENVRDWMLSPDHKDWLLVFDDFDYADVRIRRFLPMEAAGSVLITTRDRRVLDSVANFSIEITTMNNTDAESLFLRIRGTRSDDSWRHPPSHPEYLALQQIVKELHCFPLAINQAVAFIRENSPMTFQEYLGFLKPRSRDRELLMRFKQANSSYAESVMTTWEISLRYLESTDSRASWILQLLGFLDHSLIPEDFLTGATKSTLWTFASTSYERQLPVRFLSDIAHLKDDLGFRVAIGTLTSLSLVERKLDSTLGRVLNLHPLVHEWIRVRLNTDPIQQATYTIAASLVLYQTLPMEIIFGLYDDPPTPSIALMIKYDVVLRHLDSLLLNFKDYCCYGSEIPLECFTLCEAFFCYRCNEHPAQPREVSKSLLRTLDRVVRLIASRLPQGVKSLALFIHNVNVWLQSERQSGNVFHTVSKIAKSIKSLSLTIEVDDSVAMFLMMLITTCTNAAETLDATSLPLRMVKPSVTILSQGNISKTIVGCEETKSILYNLHRLLWDHSIRTLLVQRIALFVKCRLLQLLTPAEYSSYNDLEIAQELSLEALDHLNLSQRGSALCLFAAYLWENDQYRDWPALKNIFSLILMEWKRRLGETKLGTPGKHDREVLETWYQSRHIHMDSGELHGTDSTDKSSSSGEVLTSPLDYIWSITLAVAEAVSSPEETWKVEAGADQDPRVLNRLERGYAVDLVLGMESVYQEIVASAPLNNHKIRRHFQEWDVKLTLIRVYRNLNDWLGLRNTIWNTLKCGVLLGWERSSSHMVGGDLNFNLESRMAALISTPSELDIASNHQHKSLLGPGHAAGEQSGRLYTSGTLLEDWISRYPDAFSYVDLDGVEEVIAAFILLYENKAPVRSTGFAVDAECQQKAVEIEEIRATLTNIESMPTGAARSIERMMLIHRLAKEYFTSSRASSRDGVDTHSMSFGSNASFTEEALKPSSSTGPEDDYSDNDMVFEMDFD